MFILVDTQLSSMHTNASPPSHDLFLSFRLTSPGKWKTRTNCRLRFLHKIGISGIVLQVLRAPLFIVAIVLVHLGTEIVCGHGVENCFNFGNQGLLTFNSDLWALISYQTWFYLTNLGAWLLENTLSDTSPYARRTSMIIPCWNASCYSLRIYYGGSEISTRLINNQTYDTKKEVNFEHGNFFTTLEIINNKMPKPKFVQG